MSKHQKRPFHKTVYDQWPGIFGLGLIGLGIYICMHPPFDMRIAAIVFTSGVVFIGWWAMANKGNSNYRL